ncbi:ferrous-iron efflux pump FieF [Clostridium tepidiprofundi DSM 19306]|uniref:Ferrous-iron efflux pump FieF n=1 Tax=Clostridium tepidiprofundi DSM 19306 TaxID=1121338 RepID=A0A151B0C4_9CLOT|nr:cation diffusion facilitator family transporter [Clostridium tepidiprofundi]KYH33270.1 ferrous-iron efflux pump FieF [Clostridium tepidiprofundi DSM 19306]
MISKFLVKHFIKNYEKTNDIKVRNSYGYLGGIVGVILNIILFCIKFSLGLISHSIAITADAFNNLSDSASSLITILGFKLSNKPADKEHPFGHGRIEYISALVVAFLVLMVGLEFIKTSFNRILHPTKINFNIAIFILILLSICLKLWISKFNLFLSKAINSQALKASSSDAFADVITSSVVALSLLLSRWVTFPIDGYIGIVVALFIVYSGISLIKETLDPLLGEPPDPNLVTNIQSSLLEYEYITGVHDLIIHNYGPNKCIASIHAEVPCDESIVKIHEIIDKAEKEISQKLGISLVIHMDPINTNDVEVNTAKKEIENLIKFFPIIDSIHDFRIVGEGNYKNYIFDVVIKSDVIFNSSDEENLKTEINKKLREIHPNCSAIITVDRNYISIK